MAKADPRNFKTRRQILYAPRATIDEKNAAADLFLEEERYGEALEFLEQTKDASRLDRVLGAGIELGDTFLLRRVEKIRGEPIPEAEWRRAADRAKGLGKHLDAFYAIGRSEGEEPAETYREKHLPDYRPWKPEGK